MCRRWPASGTRSRSRSPARSASSGRADISIRCMYICRTPGCASPPGLARARSSTSLASAAAASGACSPVTRSHSAHGVRFNSASASSAATSRSSGYIRYTSRMPSAYREFHSAPRSASPAADSSPDEGRTGRRVAEAQRAHQRALHRRRPVGAVLGHRQHGRSRGDRRERLVRAEGLPRFVVVRAQRVGAAPSSAITQSGSAVVARSKQAAASSWLNPYAHSSPRLNQVCARSEPVVTGRV